MEPEIYLLISCLTGGKDVDFVQRWSDLKGAVSAKGLSGFVRIWSYPWFLETGYIIGVSHVVGLTVLVLHEFLGFHLSLELRELRMSGHQKTDYGL